MGCMCAGPWEVGWGREPDESTEVPQELLLSLLASCVYRHKPCWLSKLVLGLVAQVQVLKVGVPVVGFKPLAPQEEAQRCEFSPNRGHQEWSLWQDCVSGSPTQCGVGFFFCRMYRSRSASLGVSFRGSYYVCSCRFSVCGSGWAQHSPVSPSWSRTFIYFIVCLLHTKICCQHFFYVNKYKKQGPFMLQNVIVHTSILQKLVFDYFISSVLLNV